MRARVASASVAVKRSLLVSPRCSSIASARARSVRARCRACVLARASAKKLNQALLGHRWIARTGLTRERDQRRAAPPSRRRSCGAARQLESGKPRRPEAVAGQDLLPSVSTVLRKLSVASVQPQNVEHPRHGGHQRVASVQLGLAVLAVWAESVGHAANEAHCHQPLRPEPLPVRRPTRERFLALRRSSDAGAAS